MRQSFKRGEVTVNGLVAEVTKILATDDIVRIRFNSMAAHESIYGKDKLDVRYEDKHLAVIVKPSGVTMVTFGFMLPYTLEECEAEKPRHSTDLVSLESAEIKLLDTELDDENDDLDIPQNISPSLGQQNKLPRAVHGVEKASNGLVIVAKTLEAHASLLKMHNNGEISRTFRVICHGTWKGELNDKQYETEGNPQTLSSEKTVTLDAECISSVSIVMITLSNEAGEISTLDVIPYSPSMGVNVRRYLMSLQHPVVGDSGNTKPLKANRNKGLQSALVKVEFIHPIIVGTSVVATLEEPAKFEQLRIREQKAYQRRQTNDLEEIKRGGLEYSSSTYDRATELPIAYMVGEKEFCNIRFKVSPATLIPRASTETLVQATVKLAQDRSLKILDVGTGSGCLLLAILKLLPSTTGLGVDISQEALEVAKTNSALLDLSGRALFKVGDLGELDKSVDCLQSFDILVCNPPYLDASKADKLTKVFSGTEYEPSVALFAESEGYSAYEMLAACLHRDINARDSKHVMAKDGYVILEVGVGMTQRVRAIYSFLQFDSSLKDKQGSDRCLVFKIQSTAS
ncbi:hypothetical protein BGZ76_005117 [Entomortierella beljakovae]|nr:hypothetical protein BGZ76_005117 [Entomortierella beljakovae]